MILRKLWSLDLHYQLPTLNLYKWTARKLKKWIYGLCVKHNQTSSCIFFFTWIICPNGLHTDFVEKYLKNSTTKKQPLLSHSWSILSEMKNFKNVLDLSWMKYILPFCGIILPGLEKQVYFPKLIMPIYKAIPYLRVFIVGSYGCKLKRYKS